MLKDMTEADIKSLMLPKEDAKIKISMLHLLRVQAREPRLSKSDFAEYISKAQTYGADPEKDQIYLVTFNSQVYDPVTKQKQQKRMANVIFSYHFQLTRAESNEHYDGFTVTDGIEDYYDVNTQEISKQPFAECKVFRKDRTHPIVFRAWFPEFKKTSVDYNTKEVKLNSQWGSQPMVMLRKCAIANAMKQAFPQELSGLTTEDDIVTKPVKLDIDPDNTFETTSEVVEEQNKEIDYSKFVITFGPLKGKSIGDAKRHEPQALLSLYTMTKKATAERLEKGEEVSINVTDFLTACEKVG